MITFGLDTANLNKAHMTIVKDIFDFFFGTSYEAVWRKFSADNNGEYIVGEADKLDRVEIPYLHYKFIFDRHVHYQVVGGKSYNTLFTRARLEFKSPDNLRFTLVKQGLIENINKLFGGQDINIGNKAFDRKFRIKGSDEYKIQVLFSNEIIQPLLLLQKDIQLQILDKSGIFDEPVQEGNSMLYYISETAVKDIEQLNALLKLYIAFTDQLIKLSSANRSAT
ncbi:MAG TPA: hypothetical protein VGC65_04385 [Bacteroidia bacterium]